MSVYEQGFRSVGVLSLPPITDDRGEIRPRWLVCLEADTEAASASAIFRFVTFDERVAKLFREGATFLVSADPCKEGGR